MAKLTNRSIKNPAASFDGGEIKAVITGKTVRITTPALKDVTREQLADFYEAAKLLGRHVASILGKSFSPKGTKTDPDEPEQVPGEDLTVVYQLFPKDKRYKLSFTRYDETGKVLASLKAFTFTDVPSLVQVGFIANLAADLMRSYEEL